MTRRIAGQRPFRFSVHRDLNQGKPTEVDYINGELVRLAEEFGLRAPRNNKVVELVHLIEQQGKFFSRAEIISIFEKIRGRS